VPVKEHSISQPLKTPSSLMKPELDALQQQQLGREYVMASDSSTSGPDSSTQSSHDDEKPYLQSRVGLGINIDEKLFQKSPPIMSPAGLGVRSAILVQRDIHNSILVARVWKCLHWVLIQTGR